MNQQTVCSGSWSDSRLVRQILYYGTIFTALKLYVSAVTFGHKKVHKCALARTVTTIWTICVITDSDSSAVWSEDNKEVLLTFKTGTINFVRYVKILSDSPRMSYGAFTSPLHDCVLCGSEDHRQPCAFSRSREHLQSIIH